MLAEPATVDSGSTVASRLRASRPAKPGSGGESLRPNDAKTAHALSNVRQHERYFAVVRSALAIALTKFTSRGPQRDAIESSITAIAPFFTAAIVPHPGR